MSETYVAFQNPVYVMIKPAGASCNLACDYCYYLEKKNLYAESKRHLITDELLEKFTKEYIELQTSDSVLFTWHGGEPMMRPVKFYERALELQRKYAGNKHIDNCFQTNGTLITDEWARFFKKNNFLVGVSIDGTQDMHDCYRRNRFGKASWEQVMRGIRTLNRHDVMWNAMAVVNDVNVERPLEFYRFFKEIGCRYIQFTPIVERYFRHPDGRVLASPIEGAIAEMTPFSITPEAWGRFLNAIFDEWVRHDVGEYFIQIFDSTLANWVGQPWRKPADMPQPWNTTGTFMSVTISSSPNLSWATLTTLRSRISHHSSRYAHLDKTKSGFLRVSARSVNFSWPVMANVPKTASQRRPMERGDIITSVRDITPSSPMLPPIWTL